MSKNVEKLAKRKGYIYTDGEKAKYIKSPEEASKDLGTAGLGLGVGSLAGLAVTRSMKNPRAFPLLATGAVGVPLSYVKLKHDKSKRVDDALKNKRIVIGSKKLTNGVKISKKAAQLKSGPGDYAMANVDGKIRPVFMTRDPQRLKKYHSESPDRPAFLRAYSRKDKKEVHIPASVAKKHNWYSTAKGMSNKDYKDMKSRSKKAEHIFEKLSAMTSPAIQKSIAHRLMNLKAMKGPEAAVMAKKTDKQLSEIIKERPEIAKSYIKMRQRLL